MKRPFALLLVFPWILSSILLHSASCAEDNRHERLIVVAPRNLTPGLKDFIEYKSSRRPTELVCLEDILANQTGMDDPEKLKRFLYDQWRNGSLGYTLLVGDAGVIPIRYMVLDRVTEPAFDYSFYPSDLYYADLAKQDGSFEDWNGMKEGFHAKYFGEVRGEKNKSDPINFDQIDYLPEIAVGRWPVETIDEVERLSAKSIRYEKSVLENTQPNLLRAAFISVGGWVDTRGLFDKESAKLQRKWSIEKSYYADRRQPNPQSPSHEVVRKLFNEGIGLAVHAGHGQPYEWDQCFSIKDLEQLTNGNQLPVVLSAGCSTAYFATLPPYEPYIDMDGDKHRGTNNGDVFKGPPPPPSPYQTGEFNPTGLGEQLLRRSESGSIAYIGCNTGSQPCGLTLVEGFIDSLATRPAPTLGDCWSDAIRHYHTAQNLPNLTPNADWYPPSIFFQGMKFMVFGDPSIPMPSNRDSD